MADNTTLAAQTGGDQIATDDIAVGVAAGAKVQRVKLGYGADGAYGDVTATVPLPVQVGDTAGQANVITGDAGQGAQLVAGARKEVAFSTTTVQPVGLTDASNYRWVSVQITGQGTNSLITFQGSNDGANWVSVPLTTSTATAGPVVTSSSAGSAILHGPVFYRWFRLNVTGISAGTTAGLIELYANPAVLQGQGVTVVGTPNVNVNAYATPGSAKASVTAAGTRVQLAANACSSVTVKAKVGNVGLVYVGGSGVAAANGFDLSAGDAVSLDVTNTSAVWIDAANNGDGVSYLWLA